jgi:hypothetical protein
LCFVPVVRACSVPLAAEAAFCGLGAGLAAPAVRVPRTPGAGCTAAQTLVLIDLLLCAVDRAEQKIDRAEQNVDRAEQKIDRAGQRIDGAAGIAAGPSPPRRAAPPADTRLVPPIGVW